MHNFSVFLAGFLYSPDLDLDENPRKNGTTDIGLWKSQSQKLNKDKDDAIREVVPHFLITSIGDLGWKRGRG